MASSIEQLTHQATHDALTGLLNRRGMFETLEALIGEHRIAATRRRAVLRPRPLQGGQRHARSPRWRPLPADRRRPHRPLHQARPGVAGRIGGDEFVVALARRRRADDGRRRQPVAGRARPGGPCRRPRAAFVGQHRHRPRSDARRQRQRGVGQRQRRAVPGQGRRAQQGDALRRRAGPREPRADRPRAAAAPGDRRRRHRALLPTRARRQHGHDRRRRAARPLGAAQRHRRRGATSSWTSP